MDKIDLFGYLYPNLIGIILSALTGWFAAWITFRFETRRDLFRLKNELRHDLLRERTEIRDSALRELWKRLRSAIDKASIPTSIVRVYPDFEGLSEDAIREILDTSQLSDFQKRELLSSDNSNEYYDNVTLAIELEDARRSIYDLYSHLNDNRIYFPEELTESLDLIYSKFKEVIIACEISRESNDSIGFRDANINMKQIKILSADVEKKIRQLLRDDLSFRSLKE
ncbi:MAG: hypothetical protein JRI77_00930 [Deltaproteobacteria bacterium]|nr:hypothetical protein [Deltaproteobacteria bacterium]